MLRTQVLKAMLDIMPAGWKTRLSIHLGAPHVSWSLRQLKRFGFSPKHVLDVGAFEGEWALACLDIFPEAFITCIEPQDRQQPRLQALASRIHKMQVIQTLLGDSSRAQVPFMDVGSGSSILQSAEETSSTKPMTTIDALVQSGRCMAPDLIKLDVQGYEIRVLEGWTIGFDRCEVIQCEISLLPLVPGGPLLHELVGYLERRGFVMFDVTELIRSPSDGAVWQLDALFCRVDSRLRRERVWASAR